MELLFVCLFVFLKIKNGWNKQFIHKVLRGTTCPHFFSPPVSFLLRTVVKLKARSASLSEMCSHLWLTDSYLRKPQKGCGQVYGRKRQRYGAALSVSCVNVLETERWARTAPGEEPDAVSWKGRCSGNQGHLSLQGSNKLLLHPCLAGLALGRYFASRFLVPGLPKVGSGQGGPEFSF